MSASNRFGETVIGGMTIWIEDGLLYIQTKDGKTTGISREQAGALMEQIHKSLEEHPNEDVEIDFRAFGYEDKRNG